MPLLMQWMSMQSLKKLKERSRPSLKTSMYTSYSSKIHISERGVCRILHTLVVILLSVTMQMVLNKILCPY